jgi:hypothetical protein
MMAAREVVVSYETARRWCDKFGKQYAEGFRRLYRLQSLGQIVVTALPGSSQVDNAGRRAGRLPASGNDLERKRPVAALVLIDWAEQRRRTSLVVLSVRWPNQEWPWSGRFTGELALYGSGEAE